MQGRLTQPIKDSIQAFPGSAWITELDVAKSLGFTDVEWTIDLEGFASHPLISDQWINEIQYGRKHLQFPLRTVTCDFFMQVKPFPMTRSMQDEILELLSSLITSKNLGSRSCFVIPLVDGGSPRDRKDWKNLRGLMLELLPMLIESDSYFAFEFDVTPRSQLKFLEALANEHFGTNFDMGNSASLGHDPEDEILETQKHILNVHVKDRLHGGTTVPLGQGAVNFHKVFSTLANIGYARSMTLQCARGLPGAERQQVLRYLNFCREAGLT